MKPRAAPLRTRKCSRMLSIPVRGRTGFRQWKMSGFWSGITSSVQNAAPAVTEKFEKLLSNVMEALAGADRYPRVLPVLVLLFLLWIVENAHRD